VSVRTELDVARAIAAGALASPTTFFNAAFYAVRISGTGAAWREALNEFVWREPRIWLTSEMIERVRGMPVIWIHPKDGMLDTESFARAIIGTIIFAWARGSELWGVARILDADAAKFLDTGDFDTSPGVVFPPDAGETITLADGGKVLIEGDPALIDHLAIVAEGVWTKGREGNSGVEIEERKIDG